MLENFERLATLNPSHELLYKDLCAALPQPSPSLHASRSAGDSHAPPPLTDGATLVGASQPIVLCAYRARAGARRTLSSWPALPRSTAGAAPLEPRRTPVRRPVTPRLYL